MYVKVIELISFIDKSLKLKTAGRKIIHLDNMLAVSPPPHTFYRLDGN